MRIPFDQGIRFTYREPLIVLHTIKIVLVEPTHPGNIGAVARAMMTMGAYQLVLVKPKKFPHYEATKRAAGAQAVLEQAQVVDTLDEALQGCRCVVGTSVRDREIKWPTLTPREAAEYVCGRLSGDGSNEVGLAAGEPDGGAAILFGRESSGLTNQELERCEAQIRIPANPEYSSLNLASAVQIIAYEMNLAMSANVDSETHTKTMTTAQKRQLPATIEQKQGHLDHLNETLEQLEFIKTKPPTALMRKLTRLYNKADLSIEEIQILRGILTAIQSQLTRS